jgi:hypothetical protein
LPKTLLVKASARTLTMHHSCNTARSPKGAAAAEAALALLDMATAMVEPQVAAGKEGLKAGGLTTEVLEAVLEPQVAAAYLNHTAKSLQGA